MRLRASSCSQPRQPSTTDDASTTLRTVEIRARSRRRLMERATIHSRVGGINGLRTLDLLSVHYQRKAYQVTPPGTMQESRLACDWQARAPIASATDRSDGRF